MNIALIVSSALVTSLISLTVSLSASAQSTPKLAQPAVAPPPTTAAIAAQLDSITAAYRERLETATPQSVLSILKEGNERFRSGKSTQGVQANDGRQRIATTANGQRGLAAVIACIDSRVAPELVLDAAVGDLYTVRSGAAVVGEDSLGSLEIAVASGARVLLVLGHTRCAGVRAACAGVELGHFTQLLARIKPAIQTANAALDADVEKSAKIGERKPENGNYVSYVSHANSRFQAAQILARSAIIRKAVEDGTTWLIPAMYDVDTGAVTFETPLKVAAK